MIVAMGITIKCLVPFAIAFAAFAQQPAPKATAPIERGESRIARPPLFFHEEWKVAPGGFEHAVSQEAVGNPNLELKLYGASAKDIQETGKAGDQNNPLHVWTGLCTTPVAVALRDKDSYVDLTGLGRIRWVTKVSGFHKVRPIVKLADGTWLVGSHADGSTSDWLESDVPLADERWLKLDIDKVATRGNWVEHPDLSKVDEVGFVDLMPGSGHGPGGWSDVALFEVYGKSVKREAGTR